MMALDIDLEDVSGHFITGMHNTLPLKVMGSIPRASKHTLKPTWMVMLTLTVDGKRGRWEGEPTLAVRGLIEVCPSRIIGRSRMATTAIMPLEEAGLIVPSSWLKQFLLTTQTMRVIHGFLPVHPLNQHNFRHQFAAIVLWHHRQLCHHHRMHMEVGAVLMNELLLVINFHCCNCCLFLICDKAQSHWCLLMLITNVWCEWTFWLEWKIF